MDFAGADGWRMYHGSTVPGFPQHPHRGFETVTFVRQGFIDHSDSLGATARFGRGDVQWLTAGEGIVHCEMFPLLDRDGPNPCELFQIWLNLPAADKMVDAVLHDVVGRRHPATRARPTTKGAPPRSRSSRVELGGLEPAAAAARARGRLAPRPTSRSGTSSPSPRRAATLPPARGADTVRTLYVFEGSVRIGDHDLEASTGAVLRCDEPVVITAGPYGAEALVLQGRPIGEPVAQYGPFVMNDEAGIQQAFADYRRSRLRRMAVADRRPGAPARRRAVRSPRRRPRRGAVRRALGPRHLGGSRGCVVSSAHRAPPSPSRERRPA